MRVLETRAVISVILIAGVILMTVLGSERLLSLRRESSTPSSGASDIRACTAFDGHGVLTEARAVAEMGEGH